MRYRRLSFCIDGISVAVKPQMIFSAAAFLTFSCCFTTHHGPALGANLLRAQRGLFKRPKRPAVRLISSSSPAPSAFTIAPRWAPICCALNVAFPKGHKCFAVGFLSSCYQAPSSSIIAPRWAPICRRPALVAPSLGVVETSRSSVRITRPTMSTDEDNVGSFALKEMDERRTESGEGLPLPAVSD